MNDPVLVAHASKHGATAEIAGRIGEVLRGAGLRVAVLPASAVVNVDQYAAVVLGSAVYAGNWLRAAAQLLQRAVAPLSARPVWLFSSGPTGGGDPVARLHGWSFPDALRPLSDRILPRGIAVFQGKLDPDLLGVMDRLMVRAVRADTGDFRDWDAIAAWADAIATELRQRQASALKALA
jgi:menaquinone-dependent protoporphyrinogen oxidase